MMAPPANRSTGSRPSLLYPTLIGALGSVAGVLILIETFFYFGHQGTATATAAMVVGAILVVSPVWALLAGHFARRTTSEGVAWSTPPQPPEELPREDLNQRVAEEVRRQLAAGFANMTRSEGGRQTPARQPAVAVGSTGANGRLS